MTTTIPTAPIPVAVTGRRDAPAANPAASGAACAGEPERELMFPATESTRPGQATTEERAALTVCARCSVLAACRRAVLDTHDAMPMAYGVAGGMTAADRRAARAAQRGPGPARSGGRGEPDHTAAGGAGNVAAGDTVAAAGRWGGGDELDSVIAAVLAAHAAAGHDADPVTVRALVLEHGPAAASRWAVALSAVVMLARGRSIATISRVLGEDSTQITRWRDWHGAGLALVRGGPGIGTHPLARPAHLVADARRAHAHAQGQAQGQRGAA